MSQTISDQLISQLSEFINDKTGLYFPEDRWQELRRTIAVVAKELAEKHKINDDPESCIHWLLSNPCSEDYIDTLIKHLTIGETYFFRDKNLFQILEKKILPELIALQQGKEQKLRIWSAACCTGEEAYSLAMLIDQILPDWKKWNITILATDINTLFLKKAEKGIYKDWSFRETPKEIMDMYFEQKNEKGFEIYPELKKIVKFKRLNLAEEDYPTVWSNTNAMDMILCRNVLMYFNSELRKKIVNRFSRSLSENGWLIPSPGDAPYIRDADISPVRFPEIILYRKKTNPLTETKTQKTDLRGLPILKSDPADIRDSKTLSGKRTRTDFNKRACMLQKQTVFTSKPCTPPVPKPELGNEKKLRFGNEKNTGSQQIFYQKAMKSANSGQLNEAEKWCKAAIDLEKINPAYHYLLATIYQEQGRLKESARYLKHALFLEPKLVMAHFAMGNLMYQEGKINESRKYFNNTVSLLDSMNPEEILPYSEGITVGRLAEIIQSFLCK